MVALPLRTGSPCCSCPDLDGSRARYRSNLLIHRYGKLGNLELAREAFEAIKHPNVYDNGSLREAREVFDRMPSTDKDIVQSCVGISGSLLARLGTCKERKKYLIPLPRDIVCWSTMVTNAYAQRGHPEDAKCLFDRMPDWNRVAWSALSSAYGQQFHLEAAMQVFFAVSCNAVLTVYSKSCHLEAAMQAFDAIAYRNVGSWNSLLAAYADNGSLTNSAKVFAMIT
ncbi:pentatricopeptide repeat-containing protein At4g02750-like [Selaginella moellendorffii]|uniref:pentatricopeptide repeat-containing protein At4g02750-like n=1 Tax=Selaginella moellendorffii TaxID=88036 RepID=UPI000D1C5D3A|nr:pentatricopeptide repeat-containing protein At4g02750-like [Selaginella moellendorffii]XP_024523799.1 pentatricopeptide repeat-containing protein At4g02750-like [Selaginella moellendorffii]|eukprot:XP_024520190.1 pentatricopeptide repeat-containing protein At4g02750-like [Selaginella moellendorffii]